MSLDELNLWRKRIPVFIFTACALPWIMVKATSREQFKLYYDTLVPVIAVVLGFLYVGLNLRGVLWDDEMEMYVRPQIRKAILDLVPTDLAITEAEKRRLFEKEIYKKLAGVFWETVDETSQLQAQKQHFYSNGIVYSTSCDVSIICYVSGIFFYCGAVLATGLVEFWYVAAILTGIAILSAGLVTPKGRARAGNTQNPSRRNSGRSFSSGERKTATSRIDLKHSGRVARTGPGAVQRGAKMPKKSPKKKPRRRNLWVTDTLQWRPRARLAQPANPMRDSAASGFCSS